MTEKILDKRTVGNSQAPLSDNILTIRNLHIHFFTRRGEVKAIRGVNLNLRNGEVLGIVGESGCGKSVTALSIVDLLPIGTGVITEGDIIFNNENISDLYKKKIRIIQNRKGRKVRLSRRGTRLVQKKIQNVRGRISMIFQDPLTSLDPLFTVQTQMFESILYNDRNTIIRRVLDKDDLKKNKKDLLDLLYQINSEEFLRKVKEQYGEKGFYQELFLISNSGLTEANKKFKILRSIRQTVDLGKGRRESLKKKLNKKVRRVSRPTNRKKFKLLDIGDPIIKEAKLYALEILEFIDMPTPEKVLESYPHELSGGMKQRVMIGLAIANNPRILVADEPTTALDVTTQSLVLHLLKRLNKKLGLTIVLITHDLGVMAAIADRIVVMYSGMICEVGGSDLFFTDPLHPYTQGLRNSVPVESMKTKRLFTIPGNVPDLLNPPKGCPFAERCDSVMDKCITESPPSYSVRGRDVYCWLYEGGIK